MQRLTEQGIKENGLIKRLTEQSTSDTRSMMTITLISAIFLPATFLAVSRFFPLENHVLSLIGGQTLFGSNFFAYSERENAWTVASNFWVYVVITLVFSGSTVILWFIWRRRGVRKPTSNEIEAP